MLLKSLRNFRTGFGMAAVFLLFASCDFGSILDPSFNEPVKEFFDTYTNTAAIEVHNFSEEPYKDGSSRSCFSSSGEYTVTYLMRNPQNYNLKIIATFDKLGEEIDTSKVTVSQTASDTIILTLPQSFMLDADEGKEISPTIHLYEPMSGRVFADYSFSLFSNSKPPLLNNPTIMNDSNTTFVIAFDMPSQAELALRHKDLATISINGKDYPVEVSADGSFSFSDSAFTTEPHDEKKLSPISNKNFSYSDRSVYYTTGDPFENGDKEYTITLKDAAGLTTETLASTKITKLSSPSVTNTAGKAIESSYNSETKEYTPKSLPLLSGKDYATVNISAPTTDNLGNEVDQSGLVVYYTLYNGTPKVAKITKSGSFSGSTSLNMEVGSWYLETYATKTNYEKSSVTKSYIRVVDSCIYIGQDGKDNDDEADGSEAQPYASLGKAIADINKRNDSSSEFTLMIMGSIEGEANNEVSIAASSLLIEGATSATTDSIGTFSLASPIPVTFKSITVANLTAANGNNITLSDDTKAGSVTVNSGSQIKVESNVEITTATVESGAVLTTKDNVTIQTANVGNGAAICIEGNAKITKTVLNGSGLITITGNLGNAVATTITPASYTNGAQVVTNNAYLAANYMKIAVKPNHEDTVWEVTENGTLIEKVKRNLSIDVIQQEGDIEVTQERSGNNVTFAVTNGPYDSYKWEVINTSLAGLLDTFTVNTDGLLKGYYDIYLEAEKGSKKYTYQAQIKVE